MLVVLTSRGDTTFTTEGGWHTLPCSSRPGSRRPSRCCSSPPPPAASRWSPIGLLQFITPVLQLLCGVLLLDEHMSRERWIGFGIVWVALVVLTVDSLVARPARARAARLAIEEPAP